jgi:hypothetical protein
MRRPIWLAAVISAALLSAASCTEQTTKPAGKTPAGTAVPETQFTGLLSPNRTYREIENVLHPVAMFFATNRPPTVKPAMRIKSVEILKAVAKNGDSLKSVPEGARQLDVMRGVTVEGTDIGHCLHIAVFPDKRIALGDKVGEALRFEPAGLTQLQEVIRRFGAPTEKEMWIGPLAAQVGLQGAVYWWDGVGIAAGKDDTITHVLSREEEQAPQSK